MTKLVEVAHLIVIGPCQGGFESMFPCDYRIHPLHTTGNIFDPGTVAESLQEQYGQLIITVVDEHFVAGLFQEVDALIGYNDHAFVIDAGACIIAIERKESTYTIKVIQGDSTIEIATGGYELEQANQLFDHLKALMSEDEKIAVEAMISDSYNNYMDQL